MQIRKGESRVVIITERYAIKFPRFSEWRRFLWGLLANMQEADLGRRGWEELCPVLFAGPGGAFVVMPRARTCTQTDAPDEETFRALTGRSDRCIPAEWKADSWGRLPDGRLVAIDYG